MDLDAMLPDLKAKTIELFKKHGGELPADAEQKLDEGLKNIEANRNTARESTPYEKHFFEQLQRCGFILQFFQSPAIRPDVRQELLRWGVVFLHACLEDAIRQVAIDRWQQWPPEALKKVPLMRATTGHGKADRFSLADLVDFRASGVEDVLRTSIEQHLNATSFTTVANIISFLESVGLGINLHDALATALGEMIKRRHKIVHHADFDRSSGTLSPISEDDFIRWLMGTMLFVMKMSREAVGKPDKTIDGLSESLGKEGFESLKQTLALMMDLFKFAAEMAKKQQAAAGAETERTTGESR